MIILPACCTAIYHYVSYKKGWDDDEDLECDSACSECNVQMDRQESDEEIQFRLVLYRAGRPICRKVLSCFSMRVARACLGSR